jgi:hypothetical protein
MKALTSNYRLRIGAPRGGNTYIVRKNDVVSYISSDETPLALSNLIQKDAASMRFALEDALSGSDAAKVLRAVLAHQWVNNKPLMPVVEVL